MTKAVTRRGMTTAIEVGQAKGVARVRVRIQTTEEYEFELAGAGAPQGSDDPTDVETIMARRAARRRLPQ
jgi:hypothetical protein